MKYIEELKLITPVLYNSIKKHGVWYIIYRYVNAMTPYKILGIQYKESIERKRFRDKYNRKYFSVKKLPNPKIDIEISVHILDRFCKYTNI